MSTLSGSANTIATADKPEIKLKHILQKPKDKNDVPQAINGLVPTGKYYFPQFSFKHGARLDLTAHITYFLFLVSKKVNVSSSKLAPALLFAATRFELCAVICHPLFSNSDKLVLVFSQTVSLEYAVF
jgi:hypothetical protein